VADCSSRLPYPQWHDVAMTKDDRPLWVIQIAVLASRDEVDRLKDSLVDTICPDADHEGDCRIPWTMTTIDGDSYPRRQQAHLRESIRMTNPGVEGHMPPKE
jgi:hypothetical protein